MMTAIALIAASARLVACNYVVGPLPQPVVHPLSDSYTWDPKPPAPPTLPCALPKLENGQQVAQWPASAWVVRAHTAGAKTAPLFNAKTLTPHASRRAPVGAMCDCLRAVQAQGFVYCPVPRAIDLDQWPQLARCTPLKSERQ